MLNTTTANILVSVSIKYQNTYDTHFQLSSKICFWGTLPNLKWISASFQCCLLRQGLSSHRMTFEYSHLSLSDRIAALKCRAGFYRATPYTSAVCAVVVCLSVCHKSVFY